MNGLIEPPESIRRGGSLNVREMGWAGLQSFRCVMKTHCYKIKLRKGLEKKIPQTPTSSLTKANSSLIKLGFVLKSN